MSATVTAPHHTKDSSGDRVMTRVPVVMPLVDVNVDEDGHLTVLLDRSPYAAEGVLQRHDLQGLLDDIATDLQTPIRVEVHETDGLSFTDIVAPTRPERQVHQPRAPRPVPAEAASARPAVPGEVAGSDFLPLEEVAVAVVVAHQAADRNGAARLRLPPALLEAHPGLVVLIGQTSGTVIVSDAAR